MQIEFWRFTKRNNSTKKPLSEGTEKTFVYKDSTDIHNPTIELREWNKEWNYARIDDIYFFVDKCETLANNLFRITLSIDLLATYSSAIKATTANVLYSSSSYDLSILDNRIISTGEYERLGNTATFAGALANQNNIPTGMFGLNVLTNQSQWATGVTTTYFMTYQQMQTFAQELLDPNVWESLKQFFNNPMDGIIECYYIPLDITQYIGLSEPQTIQIGDYAFPSAVGRKAISTNFAIKSHTAQIEIPWLYNDFRKLQPYTELSLFVPFCGTKAISPEMVYNIEMIFIDYSVDVITGNVQAIAYNKEEVLTEFNGNCKIILPIGQTQSRAGSLISGLGSAAVAVAGFATQQYVVGVGATAGAFSSVISPAQNNTMGAFSGSILGAVIGNETMKWQKIRLSITSRKTTEEPQNIRAVMGNALNKTISLATLSGYVQTKGVSVEAPTFKNELIAINNLLDGGVYIE